MIRELHNQAQEALRNSPIHALRELDVRQVEENLLISGRVSSFYYKQLAQEAVRSVSGSLQVINEVDVISAERIRSPK
jgi:hypothetical protein